MKYYDSIGPNPRVPRIFMAEKNISLPKTTVDIRGGENRQAPYLKTNPMGQSPALELDDGTVIAEITAICEYLEEKHPTPALIGATPEERAETRMWVRRIDLNILEPLANGYRYSGGMKMFADRLLCIPEAADKLKATAQRNLAWLDAQLAGREYVCGSRVTLADILLLAFLEFGAAVGQPVPENLTNIHGILGRMQQRPSAGA
jgi:glutathione S-transferase